MWSGPHGVRIWSGPNLGRFRRSAKMAELKKSQQFAWPHKKGHVPPHPGKTPAKVLLAGKRVLSLEGNCAVPHSVGRAESAQGEPTFSKRGMKMGRFQWVDAKGIRYLIPFAPTQRFRCFPVGRNPRSGGGAILATVGNHRGSPARPNCVQYCVQ